METTELQAKKSKKGLIIALAALVLIAIVAVVFTLSYNSPSKKIDRKLAQAERYLMELKYEEAIVLFNEVLEIEPKNVRASEGLFKAYIGTDNLEEAKALLEKEPLSTGDYADFWNQLQDSCGKRGHDWKSDPCDSEKECQFCGKVEAQTPEHEWSFATINSPKKCVRCGEEEGEPVSLKMVKLGAFWGGVIARDNRIICIDTPDGRDGSIHIKIYDLDGNVVKDEQYALDSAYYSGWHWSCYWGFDDTEMSVFMIISNSEGYSLIRCLDWDGNEIFNRKIDLPMYSYGLYETVEADIAEINEEWNDEPAYYFNIKTFDLKSAAEVHYDRSEGEEDTPAITLNDDKWFNIREEKAINGYLVSGDGKRCYLDSNQKLIAAYDIATHFNSAGYAIVSEDGATYSIIDTDFNVVGENFINGFLEYERNEYCIFEEDDGYTVVIIGR